MPTSSFCPIIVDCFGGHRKSEPVQESVLLSFRDPAAYQFFSFFLDLSRNMFEMEQDVVRTDPISYIVD